jgi:hypothetical protein
MNLAFNTPFDKQLAFFRQKLNLPTERWDDLMKAAHDRAFIVAGAQKADLLADLNRAVAKSIEHGFGLEEFRRDFSQIVHNSGWSGWTGEGTKAGEAWRTKVIYQTNLATSYAAGRYRQLTDPAFLKLRPYWQYVHDDSVTSPRPEHQALDGLTLPHDHPFWQSGFPPNGWGCGCRVVPVAAPQQGDATQPPDGWDARDGAGNLPGVDRGFDYAPGASVDSLLRVAADKAEDAVPAITRDYIASLVASPVFDRFFSGYLQGEFPLATLDPALQAALSSESQIVLLSQESLAAHVLKHDEITIDDYRNAQRMLDEGEIYRSGDRKQIVIWRDGQLYRAVLKRTADRQKNYFLTLYRSSEAKTQQEIRDKYERIR